MALFFKLHVSGEYDGITKILDIYGVLNILTHNNCIPTPRTNVHGDTMV